MESSWSGINFSDLTGEQTGFLKQMLTGKQSMMLLGCAGSGKTLMAAHAVSLLAKESTLSVKFLAYTKLLAKFVRDGFNSDMLYSNIETYHKWNYHGSKANDLIIVDEAQDFRVEWLNQVINNSGRQIWMGDLTQQLYDESASENGFGQLAEQGIEKHEFDVNYRNSIFTAKFASFFMTLNSDDTKKGLTLEQKKGNFLNPILKNDKQSNAKNNQPAICIEAADRQTEFDTLAKVIKELQQKKADSCTIAVAQFTHDDLDIVAKEFQKRGIYFARKGRDNKQDIFPDFKDSKFVLLSPAHSLKGLEFDYVIFPRTDENTWSGTEIQDNLLFVLFTRAKKRIYTSWVNRSKSLIFDKLKSEEGNEFFNIQTAGEIHQKGVMEITEQNVDEIIKKHFETFNF